MNKEEIIEEFLNNAIKSINDAIISTLDDMYRDNKPYDKKTIDELILEKRLLECYL